MAALQLELFRIADRAPAFFWRSVGELIASVNQALWDDWEREYYFYPLKARLLAQYGKFEGFDIQRIRQLCNRCDGTGRWHYWYDDGGDWCEKCGGSGTYRYSWHLLERWRLGGHTFHHPVLRPARLGRVVHFIKGRIKSKNQNHHRAARNFILLLALFCPTKLWGVIARRTWLHMSWTMAVNAKIYNLSCDFRDAVTRFGLSNDMIEHDT